ncbi:HEPN domain-containing protein [Variovorax boronicumulans]|uniref:HEPN domain-containing protein n=1 Tax=Variovorax boronicumulans TaxID=436515 RepID=UPI0033966565
MPSAAQAKFAVGLVGTNVLSGYSGTPSLSSGDQVFIDQCLLKAAVAHAVGCWEGYLEAVIREFVSKTRVQAHRKAWTLIIQFESLVDKLAANLNTPSWEASRELIVSVTGMDPYGSWIWQPRFANQTDTKQFFDGILRVRHSFAHGFNVPTDVPGLVVPGVLSSAYVADVAACLQFFVDTTDGLLEHELTHRHACATGWN